jgi:hypothetical protein
MAVITLAGGCMSKPLMPYTEESEPLLLAPVSVTGVEDQRGRFREIFCAVIEKRGASLPDFMPCNEALMRVGTEPAGTGSRVELGQAGRKLVAVIVPGVGWDCIAKWLDLQMTAEQQVHQFGYDVVALKVDAFSSSANNARQIREAIMGMPQDSAAADLVLIGYSKGAPDILEAVVTYPEIRGRIAAVVSAAGAVGGSPLANAATQSQLELIRHWPKSQCTTGDSGAIESLLPDTRKAWLANNPLPADLPFYSLVTFPRPDRISSILSSSYKMLSRIDARNDGQLLFYDQVIPGSTLMGYVNADHWALTVPIARSHATLGTTFVDQNHFPREALIEAILRFVEEDLEKSAR